MDKKVFMVTEYYTPYKHNNCTERERITLFESLHHAIEYIRGTDGNGRGAEYNNRVHIWLRDGCKPEYELRCAGTDSIRFKVKDECIAESALKQGGYVHEVWLDQMDVQY